ncbi:MAG: hypothetical protein GOP50_03185 [Candidatus Heimdallarchaeota archaeon]|nr:hypothetical protein [Candidatus Heimdallarchaeota archaeon]
MSQIIIKSPNPDVIWNSWKQKASRRNIKLEKHYKTKGAVFSLDNITAAEYVKAVNKAVIVFYEEIYEAKPSSTNKVIKKGNVRSLQKEQFYEFKTVAVKSEWKGPEDVSYLNSIQQYSCTTCNGSGAITCSKCNGRKMITCSNCKGTTVGCKTCKSTGKTTIKISVIDQQNNKMNVEQTVPCPSCSGSKRIECYKCGGVGKVPCDSCQAEGSKRCKDCSGHGVLFKWVVQPVPFKAERNATPVILSTTKLSGFEKEMGAEIQNAIERVEGIALRDPYNELNQRFIEPSLGYYSKEVDKIVHETQKSWRNAEKNKDYTVKKPVYLFPLIVLDCETAKGKKFQVFSIGSERGYLVFGKI